MKRIIVFFMGLLVASGAMLAVMATPTAVMAQTDADYQQLLQTASSSLTDLSNQLDSYDWQGFDQAAAAATTGLAGAVGIMMIVPICAGLIGLVHLIFQIMALIHCAQNAPEDQKTLWILLIIFVPLVAIIYFFTKKKEWVNGKVVTPVAAAPVAPATPVTPAN